MIGLDSARAKFFRAVVVVSLTVLCLVAFWSCGGGSSSPTPPPPPAPPSNLSYPQSSITATVNVPITSLTPTVTGTVTAYSVSPALPAGIALDAGTGTISGTPTATSAQTTYTVTASNAGGSTTTTLQITVNPTAPSNLVYPRTSIVATVGIAITSDTPTVTGTVTSYAASPALPAGLSLSTTDGTISGTPTAAAALGTYTITASNPSGSTTATVQITVNPAPPPPSKLMYPQSSINGEVGQSIATGIPTLTGAAASFAIVPALPAGLVFDTATGAIYGTPTASVAQANYTVTATNSSGSTTTTLSITINPALPTLLPLGTTQPISALLSADTRVLAQDASGHWTLVDYGTGAEVASGDQAPPVSMSFPGPWPVDLRGSTLAIGVNGGVEIRSALDAHLLGLVVATGLNPYNGSPDNNWFKLASDGSYLCAGTTSGLTVWSLAGTVLLSRNGDYSGAKVFAAPGELRIALGPAGADVIETVLIADGSSTVGATFSGTFATWFVHGERFVTTLSTNAWVYSKASAQESFLALPSVTNINGVGDWLWTFQDSVPGYPLNLYSISSSTPVATYTEGVLAKLFVSGNTIGLLPYGTPLVKVIDLSGATPTATDYTVPTAYLKAYTAFSPTQWMVGNMHGSVLDGASLMSTTRYLANGAVLSMAGSLSDVAIADANGSIYEFDPTIATPIQTIPFASSQVALSNDASVLPARANDTDEQYHADRTLNVYAMPAGTLINTWPYLYPGGTDLFGIFLAASGNNIGQVSGTWNGSKWLYQRQVTAITGGPVLWSDAPAAAALPQLSPNGTLVAAPSDVRSGGSVTTIYNNGTAVNAVSGFPLAWLDDSQLLIQSGSGPGATIYSPTGTILATPPLLQFNNPVQPMSGGLIYSPDYNQIFDAGSGTATWTSNYPYGGFGASANGYVVFVSGARVVVQSQ